MQGVVLACQGDAAAARAAADAAIEAAAEVGGFLAMGYSALALAALAAGDAATAQEATEAWPHLGALTQLAALQHVYSAVAALARGDLLAARRWADEAVTSATGY